MYKRIIKNDEGRKRLEIITDEGKQLAIINPSRKCDDYNEKIVETCNINGLFGLQKIKSRKYEKINNTDYKECIYLYDDESYYEILHTFTKENTEIVNTYKYDKKGGTLLSTKTHWTIYSNDKKLVETHFEYYTTINKYDEKGRLINRGIYNLLNKTEIEFKYTGDDIFYNKSIAKITSNFNTVTIKTLYYEYIKINEKD